MEEDIKQLVYNDSDVQSICQNLLDVYKTNLKNFNAKASGNLINNAVYEMDVNDEHFILNFILEDYYYYLEYGPKPHFPPVDAILNWIKIKPVEVVPKGKQTLESAQKQAAFAICKAMKVGKTDTDGRQVAYLSRPALRDMMSDNEELIEKLVTRISEIYTENINKDIESITSDFGQI